jgi:hypothetical protein
MYVQAWVLNLHFAKLIVRQVIKKFLALHEARISLVHATTRHQTLV